MAKADKEQYRKQYPQCEKWLQQCLICQTEGYKPEMPKQIGIGLLAQNVRKYYDELPLNEIGLCEACARCYKTVLSPLQSEKQ